MKRRQTYRRHRQLGFESLEERIDLSASVPSSGDLPISPPQVDALSVTSIVFQSAEFVGGGAGDNIAADPCNGGYLEPFDDIWAAALRLDDVRNDPVAANPSLLRPGDAGWSHRDLGQQSESGPASLRGQVTPDLTPRPNILPLVSDVRLLNSMNTASNESPQDKIPSKELNSPLRPEMTDGQSEEPESFRGLEDSGTELEDTTTPTGTDVNPDDPQRDQPEGGQTTSRFWKMAWSAFLSSR